jgi:hypothetical protein
MPSTAVAEKAILPINVGPLNGVGSFCFYTAKSLHHFSELYREGHPPRVIWDLSNVEPRKMSMAGLTAFLATAYRLRKFTLNTPGARVRWNPLVFCFWKDISFLRIVSEHDIFSWPEVITSGNWLGETNPNTELMMFEYAEHVPSRDDDLEYWKAWKDQVRQDFKDLLLLKCGRLFESTKRSVEDPERVKDQVAIASAELVVNSILWGGAAAFVGLQRSPKGITVAVCDSGHGFHQSLSEQKTSKEPVYPKNNLQALVAGSLINTREYGLRRVINTVVKNGGRVLVSSFDAEIYWKELLWNQVTMRSIQPPVTLDALTDALGAPVQGRPTDNDLGEGYCRLWSQGLRGARVAFEIPFHSKGKQQ